MIELFERLKVQDSAHGKFESKLNEEKIKVLIRNVRFALPQISPQIERL